MLRIINTKERNQAFMKFMFLFLLTMTMIVIAVYITLKTPDKIIRILTEQLSIYKEKEDKQQLFMALIDSTKTMIDSLGSNRSKDAYIKDLIGAKLKEMAALSKEDGNIKTIVSALYDYSYIKSQLSVSQKCEEQIIKLNEELEQCRHDRDEARKSLELFMKLAN